MDIRSMTTEREGMPTVQQPEQPEEKLWSLSGAVQNLRKALRTLDTYDRKTEVLCVWPGEEEMSEEQLREHWTMLLNLYQEELNALEAQYPETARSEFPMTESGRSLRPSPSKSGSMTETEN